MAQVEEPFQIFIKFDMSGKGTITIKNLLFSTTVGCLKQRIIETEGDCMGVRMIYGGKQLARDNLTLKDYKLGPNATLFAVLSLCGGGVAQTHKVRYIEDSGIVMHRTIGDAVKD
eukprot:212971_1